MSFFLRILSHTKNKMLMPVGGFLCCVLSSNGHFFIAISRRVLHTALAVVKQ
nr:MAG TPA: hypothetical protein [Caudoviricetes sp.]